MTNYRRQTALGRAGQRRPSLPYVLSIVALVVGLVATQLWPASLTVAQPGAPSGGDDTLYQTQRPETLPRGGPVIVVLKSGSSTVPRTPGGPSQGA